MTACLSCFAIGSVLKIRASLCRPNVKTRTCSGSRDSRGSTRDNEGGGAGKTFGFRARTTRRAATVNATAVGAAAEEEADPEALGDGDTP